MLDATFYLTLALVFTGAFLQTHIGFGFATLIAPFLLMLNPDYIPGPLCFLVFMISLLNTLWHKKDLQIDQLKAAMIGRIPGSILGGFLLMMFTTQTLELYLGCLVLLAVMISLSTIRIQPTPMRIGIAGFFSGLFGTSAAIGGPPMALLLQHENSHQLRAQLAAFFLLSALMSLAIQSATGYFEMRHLMLTLPLLPAAWLGQYAAQRCAYYLKNISLRLPVLMLCCISGIAAISHGLY